jgi:hypothetical protein
MSSGSEYIQLKKKICTVQARDGENGERGERGEKGSDGINGQDGYVGRDGKNGYFGCWGGSVVNINKGDAYKDNISDLYETIIDVQLDGIIRTNSYYKMNLLIDLDIDTSPEGNLAPETIYWNSGDHDKDDFLDIINKWNLVMFSFSHNAESSDVTFSSESYDNVTLFMDYQEIVTDVNITDGNLVLDKIKRTKLSISDVVFIPNDINYDGLGNVILIPNIMLNLVFHSANPKLDCKINCSLSMITSADPDYDFTGGYVAYVPMENETNVSTEEVVTE